MRISLSKHAGRCRLGAGRPESGRGFSLIEVMLAVAMAAIIFSAVSYGLSTGFNMVQVAREQLRAHQICLSRIEGIRLCNWDTQLFNTNYVPRQFTEYYYPVGMSETNSYVTYYGTVTLGTNFVMYPQPSYVKDMCSVRVRVSWTSRSFNKTADRTVLMSTLISKYGIQNYVYSH